MALHQRIPSYRCCRPLAGATSGISITAGAGYAGADAARALPAASHAVWRRTAPARRIGPSGRLRMRRYRPGGRPRSEPDLPGTRPDRRRRRGAGCARNDGRPRGRRPTIRRPPSASALPGSVRDLCSPSPPVSPHHRAETVTVRTVRNGYSVAMNDSAQIRPVPMRRRPWFADLEEAERRGAHGNAGLGYFDCDCEICHRRFRPAAV